MTIEGIPEGWELVRVGKVLAGEFFINSDGGAHEALSAVDFHGCAVIRKIEKPKRYRAFENAAEFKPHRDRWIKLLIAGSDGVYSAYRVATYDDWGVIFGGSKESYGHVFDRYVFDNLDGTTEPFGVEVTS